MNFDIRYKMCSFFCCCLKQLIWMYEKASIVWKTIWRVTERNRHEHQAFLYLSLHTNWTTLKKIEAKERKELCKNHKYHHKYHWIHSFVTFVSGKVPLQKKKADDTNTYKKTLTGRVLRMYIEGFYVKNDKLFTFQWNEWSVRLY